MFTVIMLMFMLIGTFLAMMDTIMPGVLVPVVILGFRWTGLILIWVGGLLFVARAYQTGAALFVDLPSPNKTILINMGNSCARFIKVKKDVLNTLYHQSTKKRFKDMGESLRVSGHDVQISNENEYPTYPLWMIDYIDILKQKYNTKNHDELMELVTEIKSIRSHEELWHIKSLNPILSDEKKRDSLMNTPLEDIYNFSEKIYDGRTINLESYLEWFENSTAYETESLINKTVDHRIGQNASYRFAGGVDWGKIAVPLFIIMLGLALFYQFVMSGG